VFLSFRLDHGVTSVRIFSTIPGLRTFLDASRFDRTIALVPTMGALHDGHASLIRRAVAEADLTVVSIFVNPLQFAPGEDFSQYPRTLDSDRQLCASLGVDVIFAPRVETLGIGDAQNLTAVIPPVSLTSGLCGAFRPGHFQGVATIVTRLFNIIQPAIAYFGEKDAQQLAIIRQLVTDLNLPIEIRSCATVRAASGLAISSRNQYLSAIETEKAAIIAQSLQLALENFRLGQRNREKLIELVQKNLDLVQEFRCQYVDLVDPQSLQPLEQIEETGLLAIAGFLGETRLIDNILLRQRQPIIAIDGPAGAGKSTVTRLVAEKLGLTYLDTGAMYRAITWLVVNSDLDLSSEAEIAELLSLATIEIIPVSSPEKVTIVKINGQDVTLEIRSPSITSKVSQIAAQKAVRQQLVALQRQMGVQGGIVVEGRDIGTNVFPEAELKIFLTATPVERARRRLKDLEVQGSVNLTLEELTKEIEKRDYLDSNRSLAPLRKAATALEINTDNLSIEQVTDKIISLYHQGLNKLIFKSKG
jgi:pantoate ligase / CMP/dCMP kinase